MKFVSYILIGTIISMITAKVTRLNNASILVMKDEVKYRIVDFIITVASMLIVFCVLDCEKNVWMAGVLWGLIDGVAQGFVSYKKEEC